MPRVVHACGPQTWVYPGSPDLKENLEHHIEEEAGEMFEQAKQAFDEDELAQLGEYMEARKKELMRQ